MAIECTTCLLDAGAVSAPALRNEAVAGGEDMATVEMVLVAGIAAVVSGCTAPFTDGKKRPCSGAVIIAEVVREVPWCAWMLSGTDKVDAGCSFGSRNVVSLGLPVAGIG